MGLYPPIVASSMPAFDIEKGKVRIYFTLSGYNSNKVSDIQAVHITCRRQSSNVNVINNGLNNGFEILQQAPQQENIDKAFHRYYVQINSSQIIGGFQVDVLYKVQLRLSSVTYDNTGIPFYTNNIENFSQWSTVCIIKPINIPQFYIEDFYVEGEKPKEQDINNFNYNLADFVGVFKKGESSQTLKSWRLRLLSSAYTKEEELNIDSYTLADSGQQISSAYNYTLDNESVVLECSLPYELEDNSNYKLLFEINTKNDYHGSILYNFVYSPQNISQLSGTLSTSINEEEGYIKITCNSSETYIGNLVLRRSDSKSNFLKWEDLKNFESYNVGSFTYYDFTAESGMAYRYLVQKRDARGRRGTPLYTESYTVAQWEHAFLLQSSAENNINQTKQLKLKFDFQISSYTTNISESKTDTIGSRYPYIRRNGNMYYRSFPCTGLITGYMDSADLFTNENQLYDNHPSYYKQFRGQTDQWQTYVNQYDYTYERKFREKVEQFLYNVKPKLYKSMQEGNILVKLMDISLTPKQQLGRLVYTFSATAYQIDQPIISNLNSYGLINVGNYNPNIYYEKVKIGQINSFKSQEDSEGNIFKAGQDIIGAGTAAAANSIAARHNYMKALNNEIVTDFSLSYLRLTIESQPYLIKYVNGRYYALDDVDNQDTPTDSTDRLNKQRASLSTFVDKKYTMTDSSIGNIGNSAIDKLTHPNKITHKLYQMQSTYNSDTVYLGHLFEINGEQIIISPPNNIYELKDQGLNLGKNTSVIPYKDTLMSVDYIINLHIEQDTSKVPKFIRTDNSNGQIIGTFSSSDQLISRVNYKYKYSFTDDSDKIEKYVNGVKTVLVDTQPGTVVKLRTSADEGNILHRFIVNETGELFFDPCDSTVSITRLYIYGRNVPSYQITDRGSASSLDKILYPVDKDLCTVNNIKYIYFKNNWYEAEQQDNQNSYDVKCPVDILLFYCANIRRDFY